MHISSLVRMEWFRETFLRNSKILNILDVGSCSIHEDQSYKVLFDQNKFKYTGLDMTDGPNVDIAVTHPYKWEEVSENFYDAVISGQAFEHIEFPWLTICEMARVAKPKGYICIIAPNGLGLHRHPVDCWRYYSDGLIALSRWAGLEVLHASTNLAPKNAPPQWYGNWQDCMLVAQKSNNKADTLDIIKYNCIPSSLKNLSKGFIPFELQPYYSDEILRRHNFNG